MGSNASYLIQWRVLEWLKERNCLFYDLHGFDEIANPGTYKFKAGLCGKNGRAVEFLGQLQSCESPLSAVTVRCGEAWHNSRKKAAQLIAGVCG
jgi:lipid II:glycine glycyltransferase (peptidoglycan interpeptide bridge formation enzyme)